MYSSYLFIPGNRIDIISNINSVKADYIIIDFEDSVSSHELFGATDNLSLIKNQKNIFIRFPFFIEGILNKELFLKIIGFGFLNFVIPKFETEEELLSVRDFIIGQKYEWTKFNFILLIETPSALINAERILRTNIVNIHGLALGSYDYCLNMNMVYDIKNFSWARNYLLNISKAYKVQAIDIVSLEIKELNTIRTELLESLELGFDGKLFIHPSQINEMNNIQLYTADQVEEAYKICSLIEEKNGFDVSVFTFEGKVYEKPTINKMLSIINWDKRYGK